MNTKQETDNDIMYVETFLAPKYFALITDGLIKSCNNSHNEVSVATILSHVFHGNWHLWIMMNGGRYMGFAITEILSTDRGDWINIPFAYSTGKEDVVVPFLEKMEELQKNLEYIGVKFISSRPGFSRLAQKNGWKQRYVEYIVSEDI